MIRRSSSKLSRRLEQLEAQISPAPRIPLITNVQYVEPGDEVTSTLQIKTSPVACDQSASTSRSVVASGEE